MITIISFGFDNGEAPSACRHHLVFDLRDHFRDPGIPPEVRSIEKADEEVTAAVAGTPGMDELITAIVHAAEAYEAAAPGRPFTIAAGCADGRRCSPVVATEVARRLGKREHAVELYHRDLHASVIVLAGRTGPGAVEPWKTLLGRQFRSWPAGQQGRLIGKERQNSLWPAKTPSAPV